MENREYVKADLVNEEFEFALFTSDAELSKYLTNQEYKRDFYDLRYSSIVLVYSSRLIKKDIDNLRQTFQEIFL